MSERHVISKVAGQDGFEEEVAEVLSDVHPGDLIAVSDVESEKQVREAAGRFGFGVDEDGGDIGIGFEVVPATEEVEFDESILEYMVQGEDEPAIKSEVYGKLSEPDFDTETIFVVASRTELAWVFESAEARRTDIGLNADTGREARELGAVRATVAMSNVIVTKFEDFPAPPKLTVKIDAQGLADGVKESLKKAGFAIGYKEREGVLTVRRIPDQFTEVGVLVEGELGEDSEFVVVGKIGEMTRVALPMPPGEGPDLKLTAAKPVGDEPGIEKPTVEATPEHGTETPSPLAQEPAVPDPARTEGKNVIDG